ncbi:MAG TPA: hypothetical protein VMT38_00745 [Terracidiphilus sp.]|nr:hypothetical protein [Terracidiphilus sp.]
MITEAVTTITKIHQHEIEAESNHQSSGELAVLESKPEDAALERVSEERDGESGDLEEPPERLMDNKSVAKCIRAWHVAYENECAKLPRGESDEDARETANQAFLDAMPPVAGYENICDFIACVNQAYMWDVVCLTRSKLMFTAAKLALAAIHAAPKPAARLGRPPKYPVTEMTTSKGKSKNN